MRPITRASPQHEETCGALIRFLDQVVVDEFGKRMVIGLFIADPVGGGEGFLGWASNSPREDMAALLVEWLGTQSPELVQQAVERWQALQLLGPGAERPQ